MRELTRFFAVLGLALMCGSPAFGQEAEPVGGTAAAPPRPKRQPRVAKPAIAKSLEQAPSPLELRPAQSDRLTETAETPPPQGMAQTPAARARRTASIACEPGQAVLYEGTDASVWVTRSGTVTVENPLRPLTPDITRVVQLVIGERIATAYGADFDALRRGGAPAALEGLLGGQVRWDPTLPVLPDALNIVADSGASLTELPFKTCGQAPTVRAGATMARRSSARTATSPQRARSIESTTEKARGGPGKPARSPSGPTAE